MTTQKLETREKTTYISSLNQAFLSFILPGFRRHGIKFLQNSRPQSTLDLRPRELLALIIVCHVSESVTGFNWRPGKDPGGRDGLIYCTSKNKTIDAIPYEQVYIHTSEKDDIAHLVCNRMKKKATRGRAYTDNYAFICFIDKTGPLNLEFVKRELQGSPIETIWVIGSIEEKGFTYLVSVVKSPFGSNDFILEIDVNTGEGYVSDITDLSRRFPEYYTKVLKRYSSV